MKNNVLIVFQYADSSLGHWPNDLDTMKYSLFKWNYFLTYKVHCGSIRQTATISEMSVEHMRTGDKATCKFTFIKNPEYLKLGSKIIFREGRTKAVGSITKIS